MRVVILGMHRSGTSALTNLMNLLGCYAGSQGDFVQAHESNPRGHWERKDVWALNQEILHKLERTWYSITDTDIDTLDEEDRASFETRARELIRKLEPHAPWVIKDPRLCVLFPIWKRVLANSVIIIMHRHPGEVAVSLQQRNNFPTQFSIALWEAHVVASLRHSKGLPRIVVSHKELLSDPVTLAGRLRRELSACGVGPLQEPEEREIRNVIDPNLYRARISAESEFKLNRAQQTLLDKLAAGSLDLLDDAVISEGACTARKLYAPLRQAHDELFARSTSLLEQERNNAAAEKQGLRKENSSIRSELQRLDIENRTLREENSSLRSWLDALSADLALLLRSKRMTLIRLVPDMQRLRLGEWLWGPRVEKTHADFVKWREEQGDRWKGRGADEGS